jgi:hypothetical protein
MQKKSPRGGKLPDKTSGIRPQMAQLAGGMNRIAALRQRQEFCNRAAARLPPLADNSLTCSDACASAPEACPDRPHCRRDGPPPLMLGPWDREGAKHSFPGTGPGPAGTPTSSAGTAPGERTQLKDCGTAAENLLRWTFLGASRRNRTFRTARWTGEHLQMKSMSETAWKGPPARIVFLLIEQGPVFAGKRRDRLDFEAEARDDDAIVVPCGT